MKDIDSVAIPQTAELTEIRKIILAPEAVSEIFEKAIEKDKGKMVEALFPLIGAAVKRSVAEAFRSWAQSIETVIERSLSLEGLKWRIESMRTGISVAEIALKNSLLFRVEHIFLIHKTSLKILCHVNRPDSIETDVAIFAGMTDAISNFVRDVFITHEQPELDSLVFGQYTVWFVDNEYASIAAVIRGNPPAELKTKLEDILTHIHFDKDQALQHLTVNEQEFADCDSLLETALLEQTKSKEMHTRKGKIVLSFISGLALFFIALLAYRTLHQQYLDRRYEQFLSHIRAAPNMYLLDYTQKEILALTILAPNAQGVYARIDDFRRSIKLSPDKVNVRVLDPIQFENERRQTISDILEQKLSTINGQTLSSRLRFNTEQLQPFLSIVKESFQLARQIGTSFILVIEYPQSHKTQADSLASYLRFMLEKENIYDYHLIRTEAKPQNTEYTVTVHQELSD